jgi:phosphorylated CTD-interacting factor 1
MSSRRSSNEKIAATTKDDNQDDDNTSTQSNTPKPFVIKVNAVTHYNKLRKMFDTTYSSSALQMSKGQATHAFHAILFAITIRYSTLSGGQQLNDFRGGGMQGAIHESVFDCLSKWFGEKDSTESGVECFASPFNSTLPRYCSAFPLPDVDGHFGSYGDFFFPLSNESLCNGSWYEVNPPFSPGIMSKMAHRINTILDQVQCKKELDVTFVVIIPTLRTSPMNEQSDDSRSKTNKKKKKKKHKHSNDEEDESNNNTHLMSTVNHAASQSFYQLVNSPYCKSHIILNPREHGYIEGGQHLRPTKYKESAYSTSCIILSSSNSWMRADNEQLFEKELREAFASLHAREVNERSKGRKRM